MAILSRVLYTMFFAAAAAGTDQGEGLRVLEDVAFTPSTDIAVPGAPISFVGAQDAFELGKDEAAVFLSYRMKGPVATAKRIALDVRPSRATDGHVVLDARLPGELRQFAGQSPWAGFLRHPRADLILKIKRAGGEIKEATFPIAVPSVLWAYVWGIVVLVMVYGGFAWLSSRENREQRRGPRGAGLQASPLALVTTPVGGYSLSLTQILIWTTVTLFGLVYVYWLTWGFLTITPQMLVLLGIGGGTAIATKVINDDALFVRYMNLVGRQPRKPRVQDLVWSNGRPDIFKFQMLVFTLVTAYIVVYQILTRYAFPEIPEALVALMGVSSSVYVGNKLVQKKEAEDLREAMRRLATAIEAKPMPRSPEDADVVALGHLLDEATR